MLAIKDMKMPSYCFECFFYDEFDGFCKILSMSKWDEYTKEINYSDYDWKYEKRADICPLVEIEERKVGKWINLSKAFDSSENPCQCSVCGHILSFMNGYPKSVYCPNCGCRMTKED